MIDELAAYLGSPAAHCKRRADGIQLLDLQVVYEGPESYKELDHRQQVIYVMTGAT
jgi:hypothetical protein